MPDFLINTENIFLQRGICELLIEIANEENIFTPFLLHTCSPDTINLADIFFTEMETGEHYLCHPLFKKTPRQCRIFVFVAKTELIRTDRLPLCLQEAMFISKNSDLQSIKKLIAHRLKELCRPGVVKPEQDSRRCLKCPRLTLTKSQLFIIDAINAGMNNQQIAQELGISHKTVFSHKINIMKKFQIDTKQELAIFSSVAHALSSGITR
ncbi:helix-turn-helix transcriptional regulator [Klebsiella africana]|uniref:Transcriptional regulatory protein RcsA n=2 Tax=Klebsiella africana TaxID=2489010 RepID=A0A8B6IRH1_9ENTR|nr:LuxR C-terminal-related transcriptional regulator [Klebsiella africana]UDD38214.1 LuxR C-terminal-related transcriptional regulator [Klebsiella africana]VGP84683.1 Transcriptional regulatory protein RcsA [Klebsiella africana]